MRRGQKIFVYRRVRRALEAKQKCGGFDNRGSLEGRLTIKIKIREYFHHSVNRSYLSRNLLLSSMIAIPIDNLSRRKVKLDDCCWR